MKKDMKKSDINYLINIGRGKKPTIRESFNIEIFDEMKYINKYNIK